VHPADNPVTMAELLTLLQILGGVFVAGVGVGRWSKRSKKSKK
jgi:hypothetical protein